MTSFLVEVLFSKLSWMTFDTWRSPERWFGKKKPCFSVSGRFGSKGVLIWQCNNKLEKPWNLTESKRKLEKPLYFDLKHPLLKPSTEWDTFFFWDFFSVPKPPFRRASHDKFLSLQFNFCNKFHPSKIQLSK